MHMADFKQSREVGNLTVKLDVDASDAITALKAIQREARKATQALRELEAVVKLHAGEVVMPKKTVEEMLREWRELAERAIKPLTNISVNIPNITVKDEADVEKIARELVDDVFERLEREQYRDFIERESGECKGNA
jgi:hypothetical protein